MLARALAGGEGYVWGGVPGDPPGAKFPPGYPALLALLWKGTGGELAAVAGWAVVLNLLALVGLGVALASFARRHMGLPHGWSLAVGVVLALLSTPWRYAMVPLTEPIGLLLGVLLLDVATGLEKGAPGRTGGRMAGFLVLFALAVHLRTALLVVGLAGAAGSLLRGGAPGVRRRRVGMGVGVLLLALPWLVASREMTRRIPVELRDLLGGYTDWLGGMTGVSGGVLGGLGARFLRVVGEVTSVLVPGVPLAVRWGVALLLVPLLWLGVREMGRHSRSAVLALALLTLQAVIWPFVDARMVLPLLPLVVMALIVGGHQLLQRQPGFLRTTAPAALLAAWVSILVVSLAIQAPRPGGVVGQGILERGRVLDNVVRAVEAWVPPGRVVGAPEYWGILALRTGHPVVPSVLFRPGTGPDAAGTPGEQHRLWAVTRMAALVDEGGLQEPALAVLEEVCGPGALQMPAGGRGFRLVLLTWDVECRRRLIPGWEESPPPVTPR